MDYEEYRVFDPSELEHSMERYERKKKNNKQMEKKSRRTKMTKGNLFGLNRRRKKGYQRNYDLKYEGIHFYENEFEDVLESLVVNLPFICSGDEKIIKTEHYFLHSLYDERYANKFGVVGKLLTSVGDLCLNIPEELLMEILTRLPIKALARFMCVSKPWRSLILNYVPITTSPRLLIFSRSTNGNLSFCSINREARIENVLSPIEENLSQSHEVEVHSSCNGLILIQIDSDLFVWNPMTNFFKKVLTIGDFVFPENRYNFLVDLCFCSINNEYKVVLVVRSYSGSSSAQDVYVTSCGAASWKVVENIPNSQNMRAGPFFKGYRHWIIKEDWRSSRGRIGYFDTRINKFIEVETPHTIEGYELNFSSLGVFDGYLSMTRSDHSNGHYITSIELLVMKEYGDVNSWEVMFVFSNTDYHSTLPLFRTKEGEVLAGTDMNCGCHFQVDAYDAHGNSRRGIGTWGTECDPDVISFKAILYEESWFSPTATKVIG